MGLPAFIFAHLGIAHPCIDHLGIIRLNFSQQQPLGFNLLRSFVGYHMTIPLFSQQMIMRNNVLIASILHEKALRNAA